MHADHVLKSTDVPAIRTAFGKLDGVMADVSSLSDAYVAVARAIAKRAWSSSNLTEIAAWQLGLAERAQASPGAAVVIAAPRTGVHGKAAAKLRSKEANPTQDAFAIASALQPGQAIDCDSFVALFLDGPWRILELRGTWWEYGGTNARPDSELRVRRIGINVSPPQIVVQYSTGFGGGCRARVISAGNPDALVGEKGRRLVTDRLHWAHWKLLSAHQIEAYLGDIAKDLPTPPDIDQSTLDVMALTPYEAAFVKMNLDLQFQRQALKPGDEGFELDKRIEVPEEKIESGWDDEDD